MVYKLTYSQLLSAAVLRTFVHKRVLIVFPLHKICYTSGFSLKRIIFFPSKNVWSYFHCLKHRKQTLSVIEIRDLGGRDYWGGVEGRGEGLRIPSSFCQDQPLVPGCIFGVQFIFYAVSAYNSILVCGLLPHLGWHKRSPLPITYLKV